MGNVAATAQHHRRVSHACHLPGKGSKFKLRFYWMHIAFASRSSKKVIKSKHPKLGMVCMPNTHTSYQLKESKWQAQPYCRNILCPFPTVARGLQTCPPRMWISFLFLPPHTRVWCQGLIPWPAVVEIELQQCCWFICSVRYLYLPQCTTRYTCKSRNPNCAHWIVLKGSTGADKTWENQW